jgi:PIN domain nuclease of toxin-antitoxin system
VIVLDTHALIWWVNGDQQLSSVARKAIAKELAADGGQILVSAISAWEIAMLIAKDRLVLTMDLDDWLATVDSIEGVMIVALSTEVAVQSVRLPGSFHADPADRIIVALARYFSVPLITADSRIQTYQHVKTVW